MLEGASQEINEQVENGNSEELFSHADESSNRSQTEAMEELNTGKDNEHLDDVAEIATIMCTVNEETKTRRIEKGFWKYLQIKLKIICQNWPITMHLDNITSVKKNLD